MKKYLSTYIFILFGMLEMHAQNGQIAVVRPNGLTQIFTTWDAAYLGSQDGDYLYLPGTDIYASTETTINKLLFIYGSGQHPDSTIASGETVLHFPLNINGHASHGSIEGIKMTYPLNLNGTTKVHNYSIKRCLLYGLTFNSSEYDSMPENNLISENILFKYGDNTGVNGNGAKNNLLIKNIILTYVAGINYSVFKNNVFIPYQLGPYSDIIVNTYNTLFENNIFLSISPISSISNDCYDTFINNLKLNNNYFPEGSESCPVFQNGNISVGSITDIFINWINYPFIYENNFHLKSTCPGVNAGSDGHDVGIYGTNNPTPDGWVPSNPHIYFKQVDPETEPDGKLHIKVGVRANN